MKNNKKYHKFLNSEWFFSKINHLNSCNLGLDDDFNPDKNIFIDDCLSVLDVL
jgi:hypothetical protein